MIRPSLRRPATSGVTPGSVECAGRSNRVSIIIPVLNNATLTSRCLNSIVENTGATDYEIVVVNDGSDLENTGILNSQPDVRVVNNSINRGFVKACNLGAERASGVFLAFLNNDTIVHSGWLTYLLEAFNYAEDVGMVGAKLLFPDGRLQEAGGIVWRDGTPWNYGRGDDPTRPQYCYVRDVDYCSGACLLVRRELFFSVGGFDEDYCPAYFEDVDLAFKVRSAGKRVLYAPHAQVTHFEGCTAGNDIASNVKSYQPVNQKKFYAKWSEKFLHHGRPGELPHLEKDRGAKKRVLVIDHYILMPDKAAGDQRMFTLMKILRELGFKVTFVGENLSYSEKYVPLLQRSGIEVLYFPHIGSVASHLEEQGHTYDLVLISRASVARACMPAARKYCRRAEIVFDTVDLHHLREARQAELVGSPDLAKAAEERRRQELELVAQADTTFVVSHFEKGVLKEAVNGASIEVVPTAYEPHRSSIPFELRQDLLFIGGFDHPPNADAVVYFTQEIFPRILEHIEGVHLYLLGSNPSEEVVSLAGEQVIVTGYLPDVSSFFKCCRVFVAPMRFGAGISGKINHSLSYGLPVVATTVAAVGLELRDGETCLIANEPGAFADAVVKLYQESEIWGKLSRNGLEHMRSRFSVDAVKADLARILGAEACA